MQFAIDATPIFPGRKGLGIFLEQLINQIHLIYQKESLRIIANNFISFTQHHVYSINILNKFVKTQIYI